MRERAEYVNLPEEGRKRKMWEFFEEKWDVYSAFIVLASVVQICLPFDGASWEYLDVVFWIGFVITLIFYVEMAFKIAVYGVK